MNHHIITAKRARSDITWKALSRHFLPGKKKERATFISGRIEHHRFPEFTFPFFFFFFSFPFWRSHASEHGAPHSRHVDPDALGDDRSVIVPIKRQGKKRARTTVKENSQTGPDTSHRGRTHKSMVGRTNENTSLESDSSQRRMTRRNTVRGRAASFRRCLYEPTCT